MSFFVLKRYLANLFTTLSTHIFDELDNSTASENQQLFSKPLDGNLKLMSFLEIQDPDNITKVNVLDDIAIEDITCTGSTGAVI